MPTRPKEVLRWEIQSQGLVNGVYLLDLYRVEGDDKSLVLRRIIPKPEGDTGLPRNTAKTILTYIQQRGQEEFLPEEITKLEKILQSAVPLTGFRVDEDTTTAEIYMPMP